MFNNLLHKYSYEFGYIGRTNHLNSYCLLLYSNEFKVYCIVHVRITGFKSNRQNNLFSHIKQYKQKRFKIDFSSDQNEVFIYLRI